MLIAAFGYVYLTAYPSMFYMYTYIHILSFDMWCVFVCMDGVEEFQLLVYFLYMHEVLPTLNVGQPHVN